MNTVWLVIHTWDDSSAAYAHATEAGANARAKLIMETPGNEDDFVEVCFERVWE